MLTHLVPNEFQIGRSAMLTLPEVDKSADDIAPDVAAVRAQLFDGLAAVDPFAVAIERSPKRVRQYIAEGMPAVHIGQTPYIQIAGARDWLIERFGSRPKRKHLT